MLYSYNGGIKKMWEPLTKHDYKMIDLRIKQYHSLAEWLHYHPGTEGDYIDNVRHIVNSIAKVYNSLDLPSQHLFKLLWWECEPIDVIEDVLHVSKRTINRHKKLILDRIGAELGIV